MIQRLQSLQFTKNCRIFYFFRKVLTLSLIMFTYFFSSYSQEIVIGTRIGIGHYSMNELKVFNKRVLRSLPFDAKITDNYPQFYYYQPEVFLAYKKASVGLVSFYHSTGSRISYVDYSGEYLFDSKINSKGLGLAGEVKLFPNRNFMLGLSLYSEIGFLKSYLELKEHLSVYDHTLISNEFLYNALSTFLEPGIKLHFRYSFITVQFNYGYHLQLRSKPFVNDTGKELTDYFKPVKPNWSGLRIGTSLLFVFPLNNQ